jgi:hypothetical protein
MLRVALKSPDDRVEALRVGRVVRRLHADALEELGEIEAEDLVGAALQYVRERIVGVYGQAAWDEAGKRFSDAEQGPDTG